MLKLQKTLTLPQLVLFGLAYMTPIIVLGTFGILAIITEGSVPGAYLIALVAMLFTAHSYGRMAAACPTAGSAYGYVRHAINDKLGFFAGWAILLDYLFLPMVIWLIGAAYLASAFPAIPQAVWLLAFIGVTTVINIIGLKMASAINALLMVAQFLVLVAFVGLTLHYIGSDGSRPFWSLAPFLGEQGATMSTLMAGAAVACYSFLGFDAVTTLTEETRDARRTVPKAILLITLIGGLIFVAVSYFVQLAHPGARFDNTDAAAIEIARNIGGDIFVSLFMIGLVVGQFASGIAAQASGGRLIYAMGRDDVLPRQLLGQLGRFNTPVAALCFSALVALLALGLDVTTSTSFINFGAFLAFSLVNAAVVFHYFIRERRRDGHGVLFYLIFPLLGMMATLWLLSSLDKTAVLLGSTWLLAGMLWLVWLTKGFRQPTPAMRFNTEE
ncbi:amino acid permease [Zobellella endophytica]|uniref:Amino acid permease n=1 Tax=Zobellella endophytica TaxID=2116700 RepID=A0A2P7R2G1_9GAMM|nr:APC family permease [Zobellella endophytica]PSJ44399.1 amino acid permease [Zobellella endophytica]